jgi:hypothetical protein
MSDKTTPQPHQRSSYWCLGQESNLRGLTKKNCCYELAEHTWTKTIKIVSFLAENLSTFMNSKTLPNPYPNPCRHPWRNHTRNATIWESFLQLSAFIYWTLTRFFDKNGRNGYIQYSRGRTSSGQPSTNRRRSAAPPCCHQHVGGCRPISPCINNSIFFSFSPRPTSEWSCGGKDSSFC